MLSSDEPKPSEPSGTGTGATLPTTPTTAYTEHMRAETQERSAVLSAPPALEAGEGAPSEWRERLGGLLENLRSELLELSHDIHDHPETGWNEHHAMAAVGALLDRHGIAHDDGVFGLETALRAEIGATADGDPIPAVAILCEYDALPGIGHGCGHNVMCAQALGAFLALAALDRELDGGLPGRVVLQTTPAEENSTCKELLAHEGAFDGVGAAVMAHSYGYDLAHQTWLGARRFRVVFTGVPAHASAAPFMGRNALDAAVLALNGISMLRQQLSPTDRVHAIIVDGGQVPNIIPERAEVSARVRSKYPETLVDLFRRVSDIFHGAGLMTGVGVEIIADELPNEMPVRDNRPLLKSWVRAERERGREPLPFGVVTESVAAGTDFGNVSVRIPGIHPLVSVGDESLMLHTREMEEAAGSAAGDAAVLDGAYGLAAVAADYLDDARLREQVQADFEAEGGVIDVEEMFRSM